jgi:hypothetical protein
MNSYIDVNTLETMDMNELLAVSRRFPDFKCQARQKVIFRMALRIHIQRTFIGDLTKKEIQDLNRITQMGKEYEEKKANIISRKWQGEEYTVERLDDGRFFFNGEYYKSLSAVAKVICGKKVSGYHFFNIKKEEE